VLTEALCTEHLLQRIPSASCATRISALSYDPGSNLICKKEFTLWFVSCYANISKVVLISHFSCIYWAGVEPSPLLLLPFIVLLWQHWMIDGGDCGAVSGRGNRSTLRKPVSVPLYPSPMSHGLTRARTRAAAVGMSYGMARFFSYMEDVLHSVLCTVPVPISRD
jgi:hypothetical protein